MTQAVNINFDFAPTLATSNSVAIGNVNPSGTAAYSEDGINFTLSVMSGDGSNNAVIFYSSPIGSMLFQNLAGAGEKFIFDVNNGTETAFSGVALNLSLATGWTMNGQALVNGVNTISGQFSELSFSNSLSSESLRINSITATINCFCADTLIATPDGARAVETLVAGDIITTAEGGETTVKWLGEQPVDVRVSHPDKVNPICIRAGALADNVPARDLWISPDHAIAIDGLLINANALLNGRTIHRVAEMPLDGFTYYHIETDAHQLILAENCPAESYLDIPDRSAFVNGAERAGAALIAEMDLLRISSRRLVPELVKSRLAHNADQLVTATRHSVRVAA